MVVFGVHTSLVPACGYRLMCLETPCTVWYNLTTVIPGDKKRSVRAPLPLLEMRRLATSTTTTVSWTRRDCVVTGRWRQWHWPSHQTDCLRTEVAMSQDWSSTGDEPMLNSWWMTWFSDSVLSTVMTFFSTPNVVIIIHLLRQSDSIKQK